MRVRQVTSKPYIKKYIEKWSQHVSVNQSPQKVSKHPEFPFKVPLGRKFIGLFRPNSVAEYRVLFIFLQKTEQQTFHPNTF